MELSLSVDLLGTYVRQQIETFFPDGRPTADVTRYVGKALERTEYCFEHVRRRPFFRDGQPVFDHLHTDQYAMFLYFLSNTVHREGGDPRLAAKVYGLNKALNGLDVFYEVALPDVFCLQHTAGTVIGRATMSNYLFIFQRVTIGGTPELVYPTIGEGVVLYGNCAVLGASTIGSNVWLSTGTTVLSQDVPGSHVAIGRSPDLLFKPTRRDVRRDLFGMA